MFIEDTGVEIIGIDNSNGNAWTEEFPDQRECLIWLLQKKGKENERMPREKIAFEVYALDVYQEDSGWVENERRYLGKLEVLPALNQEADGVEILSAMARFNYPDLCGRRLRALNTTDRRRVYAEDYYGDGTWWEVGVVKDRMPIYGLKLIENYGEEEASE